MAQEWLGAGRGPAAAAGRGWGVGGKGGGGPGAPGPSHPWAMNHLTINNRLINEFFDYLL